MSWKTLTSSEVLEEFTPQEQAALKGIQGAIDRLPSILTRVVNMARGSIRAGGGTLGDDGTTPDQMDMDLIAIARWRWLIAFPQLKAMQTAERKAAHDDAMKRLDQVANQKVSIESPDPSVNPPGGNWNSENKLVPRTHPTPRPTTQTGTSVTDPYANPDGPSDE